MSKQFETFKGDVGDLFTKTSPTLEAGRLGMSYEDFKNTNSFGRDLSDLDDGFDLVKEGDVKTLTLEEMGIAPPSPTEVGQASAAAKTPSLLDKITDPSTYTTKAAEIASQAPGAIVTSVGTQLAMNAIAGTPDYSYLQSSGSFAPQFVSTDYGAVQQGLTPIANNGFIDSIVAYDALGQQSGGYGPSQLYSQRLGAFG